MIPDRRVHASPPICFLLVFGVDRSGEVQTTTDPNAITCQTCSYYLFQPGALALEIAERRRDGPPPAARALCAGARVRFAHE